MLKEQIAKIMAQLQCEEIQAVNFLLQEIADEAFDEEIIVDVSNEAKQSEHKQAA